RALRERAQGPVDDIEGRRPPARLLADDDARAEDLDRQPRHVGAHHPLGLELRLLVWISEALADVEVVLAEGAAPVARHVCGRDVREPAQAAATRAELGELE